MSNDYRKQGPSDAYRDVFEPGWREREEQRREFFAKLGGRDHPRQGIGIKVGEYGLECAACGARPDEPCGSAAPSAAGSSGERG
jgi:hypothetical protein